MSKKHLKRLNVPKTWDIKKKEIKYIKRPNPGAHSFNNGMALSTFLKEVMKIAKTEREVRNILTKSELIVDGKRRKDPKHVVGFLDVISIPLTKDIFRVILNKKGKLDYTKIDDKESKLKICKVIGKRSTKKGLQINLSDGKNIFSDKKDIKVGDSILIDFEKKEIKERLELKKDSLVILNKGKHIGKIVNVQEIKDNQMKCKGKDEVFETSKKYAFVVGKDKPLIKIEK